MPEPLENRGTHMVLRGDDDVAELRLPKAPPEPLPGEFDNVRVRRPNARTERREKSSIDRERDLLANQYWLEGMSEREAFDRAEARVERLRERGEL